MRVRQSLGQFERKFEEEIARERVRRKSLKTEVKQRSHIRRRERTVKHQNLRFAALVFAIIATAAVVTVAMFETLSWVMS